MTAIGRAWTFLITTEPVVLSVVLAALFYFLSEFGLPLTEGQKDASQGLAAALLVWLARRSVTSDATLQDAGTSRREVATIARPDNDVQLSPTAHGRMLQQWERPRD